MSKRLEFDFLKTSIDKQNELARIAFEQAEAIQEFLDENPDHKGCEELIASRDKFLELTKQLALNAKYTSNEAVTLITTATVNV